MQKKATMMGSSFTGKPSFSHTNAHALTHTFVLPLYWLTHPSPFLCLLKGRSRFPCADGRQNGHGCRRRVFLWRYVCAPARFSFSRCELEDDNTTEQFEDEVHPRLRFAHRGLVAMANNGTKNSNDSQFIITLGAYYYPYLSYAFAQANE